MAEFKPNIYPIMYWVLMYGLIAGFVLFLLFIMSRYITLLWFPVFLIGVIWGGYRNYKKQRSEAGQESQPPKTPLEEFKEAARDIVGATREMVAEQARESVNEAAATENRPDEAGEDNRESAEMVSEDDALVTQAPPANDIVSAAPPVAQTPTPPPVSNNEPGVTESLENK